MLEQCLIYEVKLFMCEDIYIGNNQQTFRKIMDGHFSNILCLLKNRQKLYSFADHLEHHFNYTTSRIYIRKYMIFKVVNQINPIGAIKSFTKPNCNLCMEECLTILKSYVTKASRLLTIIRIYTGPTVRKLISNRFCLSTDDTV